MNGKRPIRQDAPAGSHREMCADDVLRLMAIQPTGEMSWSEERFLRELKNPASYNIVALADEIVVGFACAWLIDKTMEIHNIFVGADHQKKGVAKGLLVSMASLARKAGAEHMLLEVSAANHAALGLYKNLGFEEIGRRKSYYRDGGAIIMERYC